MTEPGPGPVRGRVTVVGLGPAGVDLLTAGTQAAIAATPPERRFLRTERHPSAAALGPGVATFDHVYEQAERLDDVYPAIVEALVAAAQTGPVLYAVPGSPLVAERTVELLRADNRVEIDVLPSLSFLDLAWSRLGIDPLATGVQIVDGHRFALEAAGAAGPLLVAQCDRPAVLSDIKLALDEGPDVVVLQRLGLPDEAVTTVAWDDLDREITPDHLTSVWIPRLAAPVAAELVRFDELVHTLRQRCPWDREQTHQTLTRHLLEETYEVLEAIGELGPDGQGFEHLEEELGDLLFQIFFHATLAAEAGQFTLADVARGVHDKLVSRHPHVFGSVAADTADQVMTNWEELKKREKGRASIMDGIPGDLPSLLYAHKIQRKAASVGFDWDDLAGTLPKIEEEAAELASAVAIHGPGSEEAREELGDLLFSAVNAARHAGVDPETALREATAKFRRRFVAVEALAAERGVELAALDLAALDQLWDEVKARS
jgi:tetrapyrrole methylase family protein/MazG family protein